MAPTQCWVISCRSISHLFRHFPSSALAWRHTSSNSVTCTAVPARGNGDLQTLIYVLVARPRRCLTLSSPVLWQNWMAAYLGYTLRMRTLFRGWPIMVNDMHTRRRRRLLSCARSDTTIYGHITSSHWLTHLHEKKKNNSTRRKITRRGEDSTHNSMETTVNTALVKLTQCTHTHKTATARHWAWRIPSITEDIFVCVGTVEMAAH